ncbi:MAG: MerR family transcriptional regulator [Chitinophagaceae bacterium]|nr:MerR family transcriptional regulator [Chitinophagaceae bacterium]MBL0131216.1 MerR family transcriptional regulator [Chitinophagaceae bacterium]MBL0273165.1 MerR family transcriptional regulator [Chitinophagaceae bacterium]
MQTVEMISADEFCIHHNIELSFIYSLQESGLLEISTTGEKLCIPVTQLPQLEKVLRLYDLDINLEGIETITLLLQRLQKQQENIIALKNQLSRYESEESINLLK